MFIFNANAYARNPAGAAKNMEDMVKNLGGELLASRLWNEQKLAYPIKGHRKGVYWLSYVKIESTQLPKFNRAIQLNDLVLRHLTVKIDPRLIDALVAAAKGEAPMLRHVNPDIVIAADEEEVEIELSDVP
jgi:small subunit ribosomal protein S6